MQKPFSPSCDRNQKAILDILKKYKGSEDRNLLEIGSGTGQHAVFMAARLPELIWHCTDLKENHAGINMWLNDAKLKNIRSPVVYQAGIDNFPMLIDTDIVFTANTLHIMSWDNVKIMIEQMGRYLKPQTKVFIYGPFNYNGQYISKSNKEFDQWLKQDGQHRAIRDFESIQTIMNQYNFTLLKDIEMPANNRILYFKKIDRIIN